MQAILQSLATPVVHTCHLDCKEMLALISMDSTDGSSIRLGIDTVAVLSEVHKPFACALLTICRTL